MHNMTPINPDEYIGFGEDAFAGAIGGSVIGVFLIIYFMILFLALAFSVVVYVLHSLGLYTIANRRGIHHGWLAWVPLGNIWILGSISDQYQYVAKGKVKNRRKIMLGLSIGVYAVYFLWLLSAVASAIAGETMAAVAGMLGGMFVLMIVAVLLAVIEYIAYYDLFQSCQPNDSVLFLVLSIIFSVTLPFFVFVCRKKDLGMPPKKQEIPQPVVVQAEPETPAEPEVVAEPEEGFAQPEEFEEE